MDDEGEISEQEAQQFVVGLMEEQILELGNKTLLQLKAAIDKELLLRKGMAGEVDNLNEMCYNIGNFNVRWLNC